METMVFDRGHSTYVVNSARLVKKGEDVTEIASTLTQASKDDVASSWTVEDSNPMIQWIAGDFVEGDNPNENTQFWTAGDLELAEYTIRGAPLNMVHQFRTPIGFFAATKTVSLKKDAALKLVTPTADQGSMKIQALSGLWTHIFAFEADLAQAADDEGLLFYSMECRGSHLICGTDEAKGLEGCGVQFDYMDINSHCEHLMERSSVRHIVNPVFRGGALIVPPVRPGWRNAHASVLSDAVLQEAAAYAEKHEEQYKVLDAAGGLTASAWESVMSMVVQSFEPVGAS